MSQGLERLEEMEKDGGRLAGGPVRTHTTFTGEVSHPWSPLKITIVTSQIIITNLIIMKEFEISPKSYQDKTQRHEMNKCWKNAASRLD